VAPIAWSVIVIGATVGLPVEVGSTVGENVGGTHVNHDHAWHAAAPGVVLIAFSQLPYEHEPAPTPLQQNPQTGSAMHAEHEVTPEQGGGVVQPLPEYPLKQRQVPSLWHCPLVVLHAEHGDASEKVGSIAPE